MEHRTDDELRIETGSAGQDAHELLIDAHRSTLALPPDDMWTAFADDADQVALVCGAELVGLASVDDDGTLHRCFLRSGREHLGTGFVDLIDRERPVRSMIAATTDPVAMSVLLPRADSAEPVALLHHHEVEPDGPALEPMRPANTAEQERMAAFVVGATGGSEELAARYVGDRIERQELFVHEIDGELAGIGERRVDERSPDHAHLGIVVAADHRGRGLGGALLRTLVLRCRADGLTPLCSTEPDNHPARRAILRAGFRSRHTIFRLRPATGAQSVVSTASAASARQAGTSAQSRSRS